ncbi:MAG: DciA family protein [Alphaproteobacteria bacterium]|nr:DciA family protein [Alphaproteobacteria bacterium]
MTRKNVKNYKPERKSITRPIGEMVPVLTRRALGRYGFGQVNLITDWHRVVGARLAEFCQPLKILFPKGQRVGGCLHIRVVGAMALELQHMEPLLIERINTYFGYGAVASIRLKQVGAMQAIRDKAAKAPRKSAPKVTLEPSQKKQVEEQVSHVENEEMRDILRRLGESVKRRNIATKSP